MWAVLSSLLFSLGLFFLPAQLMCRSHSCQYLRYIPIWTIAVVVVNVFHSTICSDLSHFDSEPLSNCDPFVKPIHHLHVHLMFSCIHCSITGSKPKWVMISGNNAFLPDELIAFQFCLNRLTKLHRGASHHPPLALFHLQPLTSTVFSSHLLQGNLH